MIAPIQPRPKLSSPLRRRLQQARRSVAAALLDTDAHRPSPPPALSTFKSWLIVAWMLLVLGSYLWCLLG